MAGKPIFDKPMTQREKTRRWRHKKARLKREAFAKLIAERGWRAPELVPWDGVFSAEKPPKI